VWPCVNPHDVLGLELDMAPASSSENPAIRAILSRRRAIGFSSGEKTSYWMKKARVVCSLLHDHNMVSFLDVRG
jgi:hypothetical protein